MSSASDKMLKLVNFYLSKSSHDVPYLRHGDLAISPGIVEQEGLLELSDLVLTKHAEDWLLIVLQIFTILRLHFCTTIN